MECSFFTGSCTKNECSEVLVRGEGSGFPGTSLSVWVEPDARIVIKGKDRLYTDWRIESNVEEQKVMEHFRGAVKKWEEQDQKLMIQTAQLFETMSSVKQQEKEEKKIWDKVKKVYAQQDVLRLKSAPVIIKIMQETEVTLVWIKKLNELSYLYKFNAGFKQKAEVVALYNRLSEKDKELVA